MNTPSPAPRRHVRRPSLPLSPRPDAATVPLRDCCRECYPITEECVKEGVAWEEKFTRAARRRRNSSADTHAQAHFQRHRKVCDDIPGFGTVVSVDEVDRRHGTSSAAAPAPEADDSEAGLLPSFSRRLQLADAPVGAGPIAEEAEDELFPLPSPSASSSHLPICAVGDQSPLLSQGPAARAPRHARSDDPEDEPSRASVYYTPDSSPAMPLWESAHSSAGDSPDDEDDSEVPITPPPPVLTRAMPIPTTRNTQEAFFPDMSFSSFEFVQSPPTSPRLASQTPEGSPMLSASPSAKRKQFMHMPSLPTPGSFLRAGAEMFKGVSVMGSSGPMPLSV